MGYLPVCYSADNLKLPEMRLPVSISVDTFNFAAQCEEPSFRVFWQSEPNEVVNNQNTLIRNHSFYNLILTWNKEVLSQCPNAKLFPTGGVWTHESDTSQKEFAVSFLTSSKMSCHGHKLRHDVYAALPGVISGSGNQVPITKHMSPPYLPSKLSLLKPFQFTIVMENAQYENFFTEKILDAFATKTIPIYFGAQNVSDFFNKEGILIWNSTSELGRILRALKPDFYESQQAAILENYERAMTYADRADRLFRAIEDSLP
jgi:hypothetical protein